MLELIKKLKDSEEFKKFKNNHPKCFLCNVVSINNNKQLDYYCPDNEKMTSFLMQDKIQINPNSDILKTNSKIKELNINKIKIEELKAKEIINSLIKDKYPNEIKKQEIIILQNIEAQPTWNITIITTSFNVLNVKIDAITGNIKSENLESILKFKQ